MLSINEVIRRGRRWRILSLEKGRKFIMVLPGFVKGIVNKIELFKAAGNKGFLLGYNFQHGRLNFT